MSFHLYDIINVKNKPLITVLQSFISALISSGLIVMVWFLKIPNPNLILFTGMIALTTLFGFIPGFLSTIGILLYSLFFFSNEKAFAALTYTHENGIKVVVTFITTIACYLLVAILNHFYKKKARTILEENEKLNKDNAQLKEISTYDSLTKVKNRYALRHDFNSYVGNEINLLLLDVDNFKTINDTYGHAVGDEILKRVGIEIKEIFKEESTYRFGGDEFIAIRRDDSNDSFKKKIKKLTEALNIVTVDNKEINVHLSIGYTYGVPTQPDDLRQMIKFSDELLYKAKKSGKNKAIGERYEFDLE